MIAAGMVTVAWTSSVLVMFGRMWRPDDHRVAGAVRDRGRARSPPRAARASRRGRSGSAPASRRSRARAWRSAATGRGSRPARRRGSGTGTRAGRPSAGRRPCRASRGSSRPISPIGTATTMASTVARKPAWIEARAPQMIRDSVSRPRSSVPSRCSRDGPARSASKSVASGEYGAIQRAKSAMSTAPTTTASEITAAGRRRNRRRRIRRRRARALERCCFGVAHVRAVPDTRIRGLISE